jgi:poly(beta-D-mannuronate) lyase
LYFTNGFSLDKDVIDFSKNSSDCRLTNSAILNYSCPDKTKDYKWVSVHGERNRVDHSSFTGKTHQGTLLVVWLSETPNYSTIDYNYFGPRQDLGGNGGEIIRVGTSDWSMSDSFTTIGNNIFDKCDGETEIVSIKSCKNVVKDNLFYESDGTLTLRHGNNNEVSGNFFIGNSKANTGGIRIIGENHYVHNNYLHGLTGTNLRAPISVMNAVANPQLKEYWQVKKAKITKNLIVDCKEAFTVGSGKNETRILAPDGIEIVNNYVVNCKKPYTEKDIPKNLIIKDNEIKGSEESC